MINMEGGDSYLITLIRALAVLALVWLEKGGVLRILITFSHKMLYINKEKNIK